MSSDDGSSSSDSETLVRQSQKKPKDKGKKPSKRATVVTSHGRDESNNNDLVYKPPAGFVLADCDKDKEFDWDALEGDEDLELWVVRVPEGVRMDSRPFCSIPTHDFRSNRSSCRG